MSYLGGLLLSVVPLIGFAQTLPVKEEFNGSAINTNIWTSYNSDSSFAVQGGKLFYLTSVTNNGNNDSVLILKDPISLAKSWEVSFFINQGDSPVIYPNPNGGYNAFRKFGFIFVNPNNTNVRQSVKFYDEGTNRFPYVIYEGQFFINSNQLVTSGGTNQLTLYSWQTNSWYARTSKITATWTAPTLQLKVKIEDTENIPSPGVKGFQFAAVEAGDVFYESTEKRATNVVIGIIMKSAYQACSVTDNFALERVNVSEGMDINLLSSSNLAPSLSLWSTNQIITQPKSDGTGFLKITPR
jgi:hypothetical protein